MKVAWVNPSFLDYRIPLYAELNRLLGGGFHLVYGEGLIPERCNIKVKKALGKNAHPVRAKRYTIGDRYGLANSNIRIPVVSGIGEQLTNINPDIVIAEGYFQFTPWVVWYRCRHNVPLMLAYERTAHTERNAQWYRRIYRKYIDKYVSGYIANGQLTKEYLISCGVACDTIFTGGMCADSFELAQHCIDYPIVDRNRLCKSLGVKENGLTYVFVGQLIPRKGVCYLIDAWSEHVRTYTNDVLLIVGSGVLDETLRKQAENVLGIRFLGLIDYSLIYKYYAISDVFVIPTLEDNWSLVVPEAMACGLPIACSIYNGCWPELVQHDVNGTTFDPLKKETLIQALDYFHHQDLEAMGRASVEIESNFSPTRTAEKIIAAIDATLRKITDAKR